MKNEEKHPNRFRFCSKTSKGVPVKTTNLAGSDEDVESAEAAEETVLLYLIADNHGSGKKLQVRDQTSFNTEPVVQGRSILFGCRERDFCKAPGPKSVSETGISLCGLYGHVDGGTME